MPKGDLRLYDGEETLRIAARLQQERSILAKAIKEIVVDHRAEKRWLGNARRRFPPLLYAPTKERAKRMVGLLADYQYGSLDYFGEHGVEVIERVSARPRPGKGMIRMSRTITATSIQACKLRSGAPAGFQPAADGLESRFGAVHFWR